jgi:hypothetical protein
MTVTISPGTRLILRAILAGVVAFLTAYKSSGNSTSRDAIVGGAVAAAWAVVEYLTPLNGAVGVQGVASPPPEAKK